MQKNNQYNRLDLTSDLVFRTVFGRNVPESRAALIALLNLVLDRKKDPIIDLEYLNPFHLDHYIVGKKTIMDVKALTSSSEIMNIEMQVNHLDHYINRSLLYTAQMFNEGLDSGQDYGKIKRAITISIVKGNLFPDSQKYHSIFRYLEVEDKRQLSDLMELHYLELDKLPDRPIHQLTPLQQLGFYLLNAGRESKTQEINQLLQIGEEVIPLTDTVLRKVSQEQILREEERARKMWEMEQQVFRRTSIEEGLKEGLEKGLEKGLEEGLEKGLKEGLKKGLKKGKKEGLTEGFEHGQQSAQRKIARNLKTQGLTLTQISTATGLSPEEIETL